MAKLSTSSTLSAPPSVPPEATINGTVPHRHGHIDPSAPFAFRAVMRVYRFFASLTLAVFSIASLATVLGYATWFEKWYGAPAVQEHIYQGVGFSILLALLAINIFCAASIRYPWKKRQTGFVVTHIGLLVLIFGSWWGLNYSDEGQAGASEGGEVSKFVRTQEPLLRVRPIDPATGKLEREYELPFKPGTFDWPKGRYEVVSQPKDPFKIAIKAFYPASKAKVVREVGPDGVPMLELEPMIKPPGGEKMTEVFQTGAERWFSLPGNSIGHRLAKVAGPAKFAFVRGDRPEMVEDFLHPPANPGLLGIARLRYPGRDGKPQTFELRVDDAKPGVDIPLPDSDLTARFVMADRTPVQDERFVETLGDTEVYILKLDVREGDGPSIQHIAFAGQPMFPAILPVAEGRREEAPLVSIGYYRPPLLGGGGMAGNFGLVEVMGDPQGNLSYRVFGRDETPAPAGQEKLPRPGVLRKSGPLRLGEDVVAFGGSPTLPMTLNFRAGAYLTSGTTKLVYEPLELPVGKKGQGLGAALVEMTVGDQTREFWLPQPADLEPRYERIRFGKEIYDLAYHYGVRDLGFTIKLKDFDVGFDPASSQPSSYTSEVTLTDEAGGIKDRPQTITMNQPLTHGAFTLYQSSFSRPKDPETERPIGEYMSIWQVGHDAGRPLKYGGCLLVVAGIFLQFYMRAGLFTDAGKARRAESAAKARAALDRKAARGTDRSTTQADPDDEVAL